jgi:hypothetical protein
LRELERLGLARLEAPDRWRVSPMLLEELTKRSREAPARHRLFLRKEPLSLRAQVRHPGPTWLDRVTTDALAPYGLGAELKGVLEQRREALRRLGVQPDNPNRFARLRELERRTVGGEMASRWGQAFLPNTPDLFRGRVDVGGGGPSGGAYALVSDGQRFLVLPTTAALRAAHGKVVTVARDAQGLLVILPAPDREIGH